MTGVRHCDRDHALFTVRLTFSRIRVWVRVREGVDSVTRVIVEDGQSFEDAFRLFKKKVQRDRILSEVRRRRFFEKPSVIRKRKKAAKLRKSRRQTLKQQRSDR
jgi:small subunit ribosomal protein S21